MRKQHRFVLLLLVTVLLSCVFLLVSSASEAATVSDGDTSTPTASFDASNVHFSRFRYGTGKHLVAAGLNSIGNDYSANIVTPADGSTPYLQLVSQADEDGKVDSHVQFTWKANDAANPTDNNGRIFYDANTPVYVVYQMDIATEGDLIHFNYVTRLSTINNGSDSDIGGTHNLSMFGEGNYIDFEAGEFHRYVVVHDFAGNKVYHFLDDKLITSTDLMNSDTYTKFKSGQYPNGLHSGLKIQSHASYPNTPLVEGESFLIANAQAVVYRGTDAAGDLPAALSAKDITKWTGADRATYPLPTIPAIAEIDGVRYSSIEEINALLSEGDEDTVREITLLRRCDGATVYIGCNANLNSNGYDCFSTLAGYAATPNGDGTYSVRATTHKFNVTITVNGVEVCTKLVMHGAELSTIFDTSSLGRTVVFGNGRVFKNVTWNGVDFSESVLSDCEISGTGTEVTTFLVHNGSSIVSTTIQNALSNDATYYVILAADQTLTASATLRGTKYIYLNTRSITQTVSNDHAFAGSASTNISIYGPGTINDLNATNTHAFFFNGQSNTNAYLRLYDLTVNTTHYLCQLRSGNAIIDNCDINAYGTYAVNLFSIGEKSQAPAHLDIIDSRINHTHYATVGSLIKQVYIETDQHHVVNITGSTIVSQYAMFDLSQTANFTVNVSDSVLVSPSLTYGSGGTTKGTINFINNVYVNKNMQKTNEAVKDGLVVAKSNNHLASICYTDSYATVTWGDNSQEKWTDGSVPVRDGMLVVVEEVKAGESYTFIGSYNTAPFALKANLTLGTDITFNLYTTKGVVSRVNVNGKTYTPTDKTISGVVYDAFNVPLTPSEAVSAFDAIFTLSDGTKTARTLSVAAYAEALYNTEPNAVTTDLISATLNYVKASATYFGVSADLSDINRLLATYPATSATIPTATKSSNALDNYISGVQLDLLSSLRFRFTLVSGASVSNVSFTVNGREVEYTRTANYLEIELAAYEMADTITITVSGNSATYSLAAYFTSAKSLATSSLSTALGRRCYALFDTGKGDLAGAMYAYSLAARAYRPVL